mgnify:CR=1 FL=1
MVHLAKHVKCSMNSQYRVVSWNVLKVGYARLGQAKKVFYLHGEIVEQGVLPDLVTYLVLLCSSSNCM